jgi:hypothetical protein
MRKPFEPGNTFGKGRPRGAKNKIASRVLEDLCKVWDEPATDGSPITRGIAALRVMARTNPGDFVKMFCNLIPKEYWIESAALNDVSEEELDKIIERLRDEVRQEDEARVH